MQLLGFGALAAALSVASSASAGEVPELVYGPPAHNNRYEDFCVRHPEGCNRNSEAATIPDSPEIHALIVQVNNDVNRLIIPIAQSQTDPWQVVRETTESREGDCNDYATTKKITLIEAGLPAAALSFATVISSELNETHMILLAQVGNDEPLVLDNLSEWVLPVSETPYKNFFYGEGESGWGRVRLQFE